MFRLTTIGKLAPKKQRQESIINQAVRRTTSGGSSGKKWRRRMANTGGRDTTLLPERVWESTTYFHELNRGGNSALRSSNSQTAFTVMCYNILAQDLLEAHRELYSSVQERFLSWQHRKKCLLAEIRSIKPDILCLQEMQESHLEGFAKELEQFKYDKVYKKRTGAEKTDGCAVFFKRDIFELLDKRTIEFNQKTALLDRDNVGIILKLKCRSDPESVFIVATAHLLFNPRRMDIKVGQMQVLLAELDQMSYHAPTQKYVPIILTGDFNMKPFSPPYKLVAGGMVDYTQLFDQTSQARTPFGKEVGITNNCLHLHTIKNGRENPDSQLYNSDVEGRDSSVYVRDPNFTADYDRSFDTGLLGHNLHLKSIIQHVAIAEDKFASTYQDGWINVDHIFYSYDTNPRVRRTCCLKLLQWLQLPKVSALAPSARLPNSRLGSDHLCLVAKFLLKAPDSSSTASSSSKRLQETSF